MGSPQLTVGRVRAAALIRFWVGLGALFVTIVAATLLAVAVVPALLTPWTATVVGSGSMAPALRSGDVVTLEPAGDEPLAPPSVVLIEQGDDEPPLLHRVVDYDPALGYTTQGDANPNRDSVRAVHQDILGVGRIVVPVVGWPVLWLGEGNLLPLLGVTGAAVGMVRLARYGWDPRYDPWADIGAAAQPRATPAPAASHTVAGGAILVLIVAMVLIGPPIPALAAFAATTKSSGNQLAADTLRPAGNLSLSCVSAAAAATTVVGSTLAEEQKKPKNTFVFTIPDAVMPGDLVVAFVVTDDKKGKVPNEPSGGFVEIPTPDDGKLLTWVFQYRAKAGDAGKSFAVDSKGFETGLVVAFRDAKDVPAADADEAYEKEKNLDSIASPSLNGQDRSVLLSLFAIKSGKKKEHTVTAPSGMQLQIEDSNDKTHIAAATEQLRATGATGTRGWSFAPKAPEANAVSVLIRPQSAPSAASVTLSWTTTPSTNADGYTIHRDGALVATVSARSTTTWTDTAPGTAAHTYEVRAFDGNWRSTPVSKTSGAGPTC